MKLSTFAAIAAVIGGSFLIPVPAEARNGWIQVGTSNGETHYMKPLGCNGAMCSHLATYSSTNYIFKETVNCRNWYYQASLNGQTTGWRPVMPGSVLDGKARISCR